MNTRLEFVGLLASILVAALLLHNTLDDSIDVLRQDVRELQTRVTNIEVKVAGIESKLDLLIDAWDIDVPESPSIAAK
ncbi:MAG: hypothetical protein OXS28_13750 [Gammaproteobacteria bacterium]|nr:hypothetical protein [Gammaproteobacteria bacterium]